MRMKLYELKKINIVVALPFVVATGRHWTINCNLLLEQLNMIVVATGRHWTINCNLLLEQLNMN